MEITDYVSHRNADGALEVLAHLGLGNLTEQEKKAVYGCWDPVFMKNGYHFLSTVCDLYSILPFVAVLGPIDEDVRTKRESEFTDKVRDVKLKPWMRE